jgi:hypothetical protein
MHPMNERLNSCRFKPVHQDQHCEFYEFVLHGNGNVTK